MAPQTLTHTGHPITCHAQAATISLTWVRPGAYRIEVRHNITHGAGPLIDAITYPTEQSARCEARRITEIYDTHPTVNEVHAAYGADAWLRPPCQQDAQVTDDVVWLLAASVYAARAIQQLPASQRPAAWRTRRTTIHHAA